MLWILYFDVVVQVIVDIGVVGGMVCCDFIIDFLYINDEFIVLLVIFWCYISFVGGLCWKVCFDSGLRFSIIIVVWMQEDNVVIYDYYLLLWLDVGVMLNLWFVLENGILFDVYCFDILEVFFDLMCCVLLKVVV